MESRGTPAALVLWTVLVTGFLQSILSLVLSESPRSLVLKGRLSLEIQQFRDNETTEPSLG